MPSERERPPNALTFSPAEFSSRLESKNGWCRLAVDKELFDALGKRAVEWRMHPNENELEAVFDELKFKTSFPKSDTTELLHPAHFYVSKNFIEVECHGQTAKLKSGESIKLLETWTLCGK